MLMRKRVQCMHHTCVKNDRTIIALENIRNQSSVECGRFFNKKIITVRHKTDIDKLTYGVISLNKAHPLLLILFFPSVIHNNWLSVSVMVMVVLLARDTRVSLL